MKLILIIMVFLILGALLIISNNNLALCKDKNISIFKILYIDWLDSIYKNSQSITGNVIKINWLPK